MKDFVESSEQTRHKSTQQHKDHQLTTSLPRKQPKPQEYYEMMLEVLRAGASVKEISEALQKQPATIRKTLKFAVNKYGTAEDKARLKDISPGVVSELNALDKLLEKKRENEKGKDGKKEQNRKDGEELAEQTTGLIDEQHYIVYQEFKHLDPQNLLANPERSAERASFLQDVENFILKKKNLCSEINHIAHIAWLKTDWAEEFIEKKEQETQDLHNDPLIAELINFDVKKLGEYDD